LHIQSNIVCVDGRNYNVIAGDLCGVNALNDFNYYSSIPIEDNLNKKYETSYKIRAMIASMEIHTY